MNADRPGNEFLEERLWLFYRHVFCAVDTLLSPSVARAGLSLIQARILFSICESCEISVGELSGEIRMNPGNCSSMCKKLEASGLINRFRSRDDERIVLLSPTERGKSIIKKILLDTHELLKAVLEDLSLKERDEILKSLAQVEAFFKALQLRAK